MEQKEPYKQSETHHGKRKVAPIPKHVNLSKAPIHFFDISKDKYKNFNLEKTIASSKKYLKTKYTQQPRVFIGISVTILIIVALIIYSVIPQRSVQAFCDTFKKEGTALHDKYQSAADGITKSSYSLSSMISGMGSIAQEPGDMAVLFDRLDKVAPNDIEPDVAAVRDALKKNNDTASKASGNWLSAIASSFVTGLQSMGSMQKVDSYITKNCDTSYMSSGTTTTTATTNTDATASQADQTNYLSVDGIDKDSMKLWEHKQSGVVANLNGSLVLINPTTFKITAQHTLPAVQGRTPGGDSGKSYTLKTDDGIELSDFSKDFQYIPLEFKEGTDDKDLTSVGYYDLGNDNVTDITSSVGTGRDPKNYDNDFKPYFDPNNRNILIFNQGNRYGGFMWQKEFDLTTRSVTDYKPDPSFTSDSFVWNKAHTSRVRIIMNNNTINRTSGGTGLGCNPIQMITDTAILCSSGTSSLQLEILDISNIINDKALTDDPNSYNYVKGHLHYEIPDPVLLDGTTGSDYLVSSDAKTVISTDDKVIYSTDLVKNETKKVADLSSSDKFSLLEWYQK
jgi:hypothetical protein